MRTANRLASLALALTLLGGGLLLAIEAILVALDRPALMVDRSGWYATLTTTRLGAPAVRGVAGTVAGVGLVILVAELCRWRPVRLAASGRHGWHLTRRSVEQRLATAVRAVPGVRQARVRVRRGGPRWRPQVVASGDPAARADVAHAVRRELRLLTDDPARPPARVRFSGRRDRS